jgi:hypothetical protein
MAEVPWVGKFGRHWKEYDRTSRRVKKPLARKIFAAQEADRRLSTERDMLTGERVVSTP